MRSLMNQVAAFMTAADQGTGGHPGDCSSEQVKLAMSLIAEEYSETHRALQRFVDHPEELQNNPRALADAADALGDLLYVATWAALALGLPMVEIMAEIQRSNLAKFGPGARRRKDGKVLKPRDWTPPDLLSIIKAAIPAEKTR